MIKKSLKLPCLFEYKMCNILSYEVVILEIVDFRRHAVIRQPESVLF